MPPARMMRTPAGASSNMAARPPLLALESLASQWRASAQALRAAGDLKGATQLWKAACDLSAAPSATETARAPLATDRLWTQPEAAYYLGVSARYLRESDCPKVLLPGTGKKGQPLVRYEPAAVMAWKDAWRTRSPQRAG